MSEWQEWEHQFLAPWAAKSDQSLGRAVEEAACPLRTVWQRDRDRIIHCKAFRRLKHKTQVFINPQGDHFRTRLTHTLEVAQISRTIARALHLNEDLTEAIALGHDLGHAPFGHAGERALASVVPSFTHNRQSVRVAEVLEHDGRGLNLTVEVLDGMLCHSGEQLPQTLEGMIVRYCDRVAYLNHDIADAIRSGYLEFDAIPRHLITYLGDTHSQRINTMVTDIVRESRGKPVVLMSEECSAISNELRTFMFEHVYFHPQKIVEEQKLEAMLVRFFDYFMEHFDCLPVEFQREPKETAACDYIAGMTDNFALGFAKSIHSL